MAFDSILRCSLALCSVLVVGCGADERAPAAGLPPAGADRTTATITPGEGGTLKSADGRLVITFPPGAVASPTEVWVESVPKDKAEADFPAAVPKGLAYALGPDGQQFAVAAAAVLTLAAEEVPTTEAGMPAMALSTRSAAGDEVLTTTLPGSPLGDPMALTEVDATTGRARVHGDVRHFSDLWVAPGFEESLQEGLYVLFETTAQPTQRVGDHWFSNVTTSNRRASEVTIAATSVVGTLVAVEAIPCAESSIAIVPRGDPCGNKPSTCCDFFVGELVGPNGGVVAAGEVMPLANPPEYRCAKVGPGDFELLVHMRSVGRIWWYALVRTTHVECVDGKLATGSACAVGSDCDSGSCIDQFCCNSSCEGTCQKCSVAGSEGTCSPVPAGEHDDDTCTGTSACSATGECKPDLGQTCSSSNECASSQCVDGFCCDSACAGTCMACDVAGLAGTCSSVPAGQTDPGTCDGLAQCSGAGCVAANGEPCPNGPSDCLSGQCADGVCCDFSCTLTCEACDLPGSVGTCTAVPAGTSDPTCSSPDTCDGGGSCAAPAPNGTACQSGAQCASTFCVDGFCCSTACDQLCETCAAAKKLSGNDGQCGFIKSGQDYDNECADPLVCHAGACKAPQGAPCVVWTDCVGNMLACRDGVCCNNSFCADGGSSCTACTMARTGQPDGTCAPVFAGTDPFDTCQIPPNLNCVGPAQPGTCGP